MYNIRDIQQKGELYMSISIMAGTQNPVKLAAITAAFSKIFEDDVKVRGYEVESHVPMQPINEDVYKGAENRLEELKQYGEEYDFLVSCEGGMIQQFGHWFNVQIILVEDKDGKRGFGLSQGYEIPEQYVKEAILSSVAQVLDRILEGKGGIRVLSKNQFTRENLIHDGVIMALTKVLNGEKW